MSTISAMSAALHRRLAKWTLRYGHRVALRTAHMRGLALVALGVALHATSVRAEVAPQAAAAADNLGDARAAHAQACREQLPSCDWLDTLSPLERASVTRALAARHLEVDNTPWNKVIDDIDVFVEPVFVEGGRYVRLLNMFHVESKEPVVAREMLIDPGEPWDQLRIEESARRLRDPLFSSVAVVIPIKRADVGHVGVLVVTRDIWSFRFNTLYRVQNNQLTNLSFSLSEQNFLGRRKIVAFDFNMTQDQVAIGPQYIDRNVMGKRLRLNATVNSIFARGPLLDSFAFRSEGTQSQIDLSRPLWSLASKWGYGVSVSHRNSIERLFKGTSLRTFDAPSTPDDDLLPWAYRQRRFNSTLSVQRQLGAAVKHRFTMGHSIESQRPRVLSDFVGDAAQLADFQVGVLPRSELNSVLFATYNTFTPNYRTLHNIDTYDLSEDLQFGPNLTMSIGVSPTLLGSSATFVRGKVDASWTEPWCHDGYVQANVGAFTRRQAGDYIDNTADATLRVVGPSIKLGRIVTRLRLATRWNDTQNRFYTVGSESGLRGFRVSEFNGQRLMSFQIEARSKPLRYSAFRAGGVLFYELGGSADAFAALPLHQDAGVGLRFLTPQTSRELVRFDFAFPFDGVNRGRPQFIAGFGSDF
ncbi:MAG: hypothetical protein KBG15_07575 [Kofleriaceae bacterium]|nr:hypothetical protein [Kofleriaceae bacterium]